MLPPCRSWVDNLGVGLLPWIASASLPLFGSYVCVCVCVCVCVFVCVCVCVGCVWVSMATAFVTTSGILHELYLCSHEMKTQSSLSFE